MNTQEQNQTTAQNKFYSKKFKSNTCKGKKLTDNQLKAIREKRTYLQGLSEPLKDLVSIGEIENINEGLKNIYAAQGYCNLKSLRQWNEQGYSVKKGEKALLLWGKPISKQRDQQDKDTDKQTEEQKDTFDLFPLCYVFAFNQVEQKEVYHA